MARWKQTYTCEECGDRRWQEAERDQFAPAPDLDRFPPREACVVCGSRQLRWTQEALDSRWNDAFRPGGMRLGLVTFEESAARDAQVLEAQLRGK